MLLSRLWNELECMSEEVSERRTAIFSKRLVCHRTLFHILQVFYMVYQVVIAFDIINLLAPRLTQPAVFFLLFDSCEAATTKIGSDADGGEWTAFESFRSELFCDSNCKVFTPIAFLTYLLMFHISGCSEIFYLQSLSALL